MGARVAVLSDVHGNPWALRAALDAVHRQGVDLIVNCGDLVAGPWPVEVVDELLGCGIPVTSVRGNGDRMIADAYDGHWDDVPAAASATVAWAAARLRPSDRAWIGGLPLTIEVDVDGLGELVCFHATPRSDEEILLPTTDERRVDDLLGLVGPAVAVHGHSHLPDDRPGQTWRLINVGSVGKPFTTPGAEWALLGPDVELRRTDYDIAAAVDTARREFAGTTDGDVTAEEFTKAVAHPPGRDATLEVFGRAEAEQNRHLAPRSMLRKLDEP